MSSINFFAINNDDLNQSGFFIKKVSIVESPLEVSTALLEYACFINVLYLS